MNFSIVTLRICCIFLIEGSKQQPAGLVSEAFPNQLVAAGFTLSTHSGSDTLPVGPV